MLITAAQARNLYREIVNAPLLNTVSNAIRSAAASGYGECDILGLIPNAQAYANGADDDTIDEVVNALVKAGYKVERVPVKSNLRAQIKVTWAN